MNIESLEITERKEVFDFVNIKDIVNQTLLKNQKNNIAKISGIPTGYKKIDEITNGFQKGELTIIAVKPGIGKTSFLLSLTNNIAVRNNRTVAIFSSERPAEKLVKRMLETETGMSVDKLNGNKLTDGSMDHINAIVNTIANAKIFIDDTPSLSLDEFCTRAKQLVSTQQIDLILIDHLELMTTSILDQNERSEQLKNITRTIKVVAEELNIPIVLFSQVQSNVHAPNATITESLLPEYIEDHNDVIMLLNRTPYSLIKSVLTNKSGDAEIILAKHAQLKERKVIGIKFIESIGKFVDSE